MKMPTVKTLKPTQPSTVAPAKAVNQAGFASIVIALTLILVLALITVGFAQLARREQQEALSRQLSTQANYAAESAINDAVKDLSLATTVSGASFTPVDPNKCYDTNSDANQNNANLGSSDVLSNQNLSATTDVGYTCVLINVQPGDLKKTLPNPFGSYSTVFHTFNGASATHAKTINFSWDSSNGYNTYVSGSVASNHSLLPANDWSTAGYPPVVKITLTPITSAGYTRSDLIDHEFSFYLYPSSNNTHSNVDYPTITPANPNPSDNTTNGTMLDGNCGAKNPDGSYLGLYTCNASLTNLDSIYPGITDGSYLLHAQTLYGGADLDITAQDDSGAVQFAGSQAQIDATGKAKDVLKRLQVRVGLPGLPPDADLPTDAIESKDLCKRFSTNPAYDPSTGLPAGYETDPDGFSAACTFDNTTY